MSTNWDFQQSQQTGQLWLEMFSNIGSMFTAVQPGSPPNDAARQMRTAAFKQMTEQTEQFMRSEQFLQALKQGMDRTLEAQQQYQAFMTNLRHVTEGVAAQDVHAVMAAMRQTESRVLDRLEEVSSQINRLSKRLDRYEKGSEEIDPTARDDDVLGTARQAKAARRNGEEKNSVAEGGQQQ